MENQEQSPEAKRVALPAHLLQRLQAFRIGQVDHQSYVVRDRLHGKHYDFEPWQFFVLEVLPSCQSQAQLASVFQDRFGYPLPEPQTSALFVEVADAGLLNEAAADHPLLRRFAQKRYEEVDGQPKLKSFRNISDVAPSNGQRTVVEISHKAKPGGLTEGTGTDPTSAAVQPPPGRDGVARGVETVASDEVLPPGLQDSLDFDPRARKKMMLGLDPRPVLRALSPLLRWTRWIALLLPLLVVLAAYRAIRHADWILADAATLLSTVGVFHHVLFSLLTVNLLVAGTTALVAHNFRATVSRFGLVLVLGFLPRFGSRITHVKQLSRFERLWLHAAPLLVRLGAFAGGILIWGLSRNQSQVLAQAGLMLASVSLLGWIISANPLAKGSGYQLLCAYSNEANLKGKSFKALLSRLRGEAFKEFDELLLATYAMASILFLFFMIVAAVLVLGAGLHRIHLGGSAWIVMGTVGFLLTRKAVRYFGGVQRAYERAEQFERWRKRAIPQETSESHTRTRPGIAAYLARAAAVCLFATLFLPYSYSPGGPFSATPALQQVISTDMSGLVTRVYYEGGEFLREGTVIADLASSETEAKLEVAEAQIAEQCALIADLRSQPRAVDVQLAVEALKTSKTRLEVSMRQLQRLEALHSKGVIPSEELDLGRGDYQVKQGQVDENSAELLAVQQGPSPEQLAAAEAKLTSLHAERDSYAEQIARSQLRMPFDGRLLTLNLKQRGNSYYERGAKFAAAEMSGPMTAESRYRKPTWST